VNIPIVIDAIMACVGSILIFAGLAIWIFEMNSRSAILHHRKDKLIADLMESRQEMLDALSYHGAGLALGPAKFSFQTNHYGLPVMAIGAFLLVAGGVLARFSN
jgi:hypothetical protein